MIIRLFPACCCELEVVVAVLVLLVRDELEEVELLTGALTTLSPKTSCSEPKMEVCAITGRAKVPNIKVKATIIVAKKVFMFFMYLINI